jgi:hypothetical protein
LGVVCEELRKIQISGQKFHFRGNEGAVKSAEVALQLRDRSAVHNTFSGKHKMECGDYD